MANSKLLQELHQKMKLNENSKHEDEQIASVITILRQDIEKELKVKLEWKKKITLKSIITELRKKFPKVSFADPEVEASSMSPDGGITFLVDKNGKRFPILIGEVKNQGTNDRRAKEGLPKQARGNAVERLGKNVIGFRTYMIDEGIFPYVCFGDGCDFEKGSSILDRVLTISMFGELNKDHTSNEGLNGVFNRGSYYFRAAEWKLKEIYEILYNVAKRSIYYYFSKYGEENFR